MLNITKEFPAEMQTLVDRLFDDFDMPRIASVTTPALDLYEKDGKYILELAVPGYDPKDVNVEINAGAVTVSGTHIERTEKKDAKFLRRELRRGSFTRTVALPQDVDPESVDAHVDKGMLTVSMTPLKPIAPKKITVR